ncbi:hypothetical protein V9T40_005673 [Parthenolecanium corni]|uniref:Vacuolar protein sorting-associated protein 33A n=1 Tax=Parthenolecanium corni TaxID=536013 RepID=A0AAN9YAZ8_9HEMI
MSAHLSRGKLNIGLVQEQARKELLDLLDRCQGSKIIIWDDGLSGPFGSIAEYSLLKKWGVKVMFPLRPGKLKLNDVDSVIFITRPYLKLMNCIIDIIHGEDNSRKIKKWHLFFVPFKSLLCEEYLKNKGVFGSLTSVEQISHCLIFPFDNDLMSMEIESAFKEFYVESDPTCLFQISKTIVMLEELFGPIKRISGKGKAANQVIHLFERMKNQNDNSSPTKYQNVSQIDQLILIDRESDLLSPLATQLTYQGLIDELFGINNSVVKLPAEKFAQDEGSKDVMKPTDDKHFMLNSSDEVFSEICDKNFSAIGQSLSRRTKLISSQIEERHDKSLQEMKLFVAKLPHLLAVKKSLGNHMTIAEMIKDVTKSDEFGDLVKNEHEMILGSIGDRINPYVEDLMAHKADLVKVLRLICVQSIVSCGLKSKVLDQYKRDIIQTYGFQHILTLTNLEKAGLLRTQQGSRSFAVLRKTLKLISDDNSGTSSEPKDIHFVHELYAPLSVRLVQQFVKPQGIRNLNDVISLIPGSIADFTIDQKSSPFPQRRGSINSLTDSAKVVLVFFIGGCTYAEIAALRFLSQQEESNAEFVIATTKIINGNTFIKSLMEPLVDS